MEAMEQWLSSQQGDLPTPGLHLLEAALASWRYCPQGVLPEGLREDLQQALGRGSGSESGVESAGLSHFRGSAGTGSPWTPPSGRSASCCIRLPPSDAGKSSVENGPGDGDGRDISFPAGAILTAVGTILHSGNGTGRGTFPHCGRGALPDLENPLSLLVALGSERGGWGQNLAFGPFASQDWGGLYPYYDWEAFRDTIALYDPCAKKR